MGTRIDVTVGSAVSRALPAMRSVVCIGFVFQKPTLSLAACCCAWGMALTVTRTASKVKVINALDLNIL